MRRTRAAVGLLILVVIVLLTGVRQLTANTAQPTDGSMRGAPEVTPDSGNTAQPTLGTTRNAVIFSVRNPGPQTEQYSVKCVAEAGVSSCRVKSARIVVRGGQTAHVPVWYTMKGKGRVVLEARVRNMADRGHYSIDPKPPGATGPAGEVVSAMDLPGGTQQPLVSVYPAAGYYTSSLPVMIEWCGLEGGEVLQANTRWVKRINTNITSSFSFDPATISGCVDAYESTGSVTLTSEWQLVNAYICGAPELEPEPASGPNMAMEVDDNCGGGGNYYHGSSNQGPVADGGMNPGTRIVRPECVISDAGPAAAFQCGDLMMTHTMPAFKALNKNQTLTLLYNSSTAKIQPVIMADVTVPSATPGVSSLTATLSIDSVSQGSFTFSGANLGNGATEARRIAVSVDGSALGTGVHQYSMAISAQFASSCGTCTDTISGEFIVVNRSDTPLGSGWALAGMEQIYAGQRNGALLFVEGDGSASVFEPVDSVGGVPVEWLAPAGGFRDRIHRAASYNDSIYYYRTQLDGTQIEYNVAGLQTWVKGLSGQKVQYSYSSNTSPTALLNYIRIAPHNQDQRFTLAYASGKLDYITDPAGRVMQATVSSNQLIDLQDPGRTSTEKVGFTYSNGLLASRTAPSGHTATYAYVNRSSQLSQATMPATQVGQEVFHFTPIQSRGLWQSAGSQTVGLSSATVVINSPLPSHQATIKVNRWGAPVEITEPLNKVTAISRDSVSMPSLPTKITAQSCRITRVTWNPNATVKQVRDSTSHTGSECGGHTPTPTSVVSYQYSSVFPNRISVDSARDGTSTYFTYWGESGSAPGASGSIQTVTAPNGHVTRFTYIAAGDTAGLLNQVVEEDVETWMGWGVADSAVDQTTTFRYNSVGNLIATFNALGDSTTYVKDGAGRDTISYDEAGHKTVLHYNALNQLAASIRFLSSGDSAVTTYNHTTSGLESIADSRSVKRFYEYDALGRLIVERGEDSIPEFHNIGAGGLLESTVTRTGHTIRMQYDYLGRLKKKWWEPRTMGSLGNQQGFWWVPGPAYTIPSDTISYTYTTQGWASLIRSNDWAVSRNFRANGSIAQEVQKKSDNTNPITHTYTYDVAGRRTGYRIGSTIVPTQSDSIRYTYGTITGQLEAISALWRGTTGKTDEVVFEWDRLGRRRKLTYNTGSDPIEVTYSYDMAGRFRRLCSNQNTIENMSVFNVYLAHDTIRADGLVGRRTSMSIGDACAHTGQTFSEINTYDALHQLTGQNRSGSDGYLPFHRRYEYDKSGNMVRDYSVLGFPGDTMIAEIEPMSNRLDYWGDQGHDSRLRYAYDSAGARSSQMHVNSSDNNLERLGNVAYFYDALGRTTGYQNYYLTDGYGFEPDTARPTVCKYGPTGQLWMHCNSDHGRRLGYDGDNIVRTGSDGTDDTWTFVHAPGVDEPLMGSKNTLTSLGLVTYYWITDGKGRSLAVGDAAGVNRRRHADADSSQLRDGEDPGAIEDPGYAASRLPNSAMPGLSFFRNRFYDQASGRWTQEDPLGAAGGVNLYSYAGNNPVSYTDPFGLCPIPPSSCFQAIANWGAQRGGTTGAVALNAGAGLAALGEVAGLGDAEAAVSAASEGRWAAAATSAVFALPGGKGGKAAKAVGDFVDNPGGWKRVGAFIESATNRRARGGASIQEVFENADGEWVVQHTVVNRAGHAIDGPHPRDGYKPRVEEIDR